MHYPTLNTNSYLFLFFKSLQSAGFALGIEEYKLLLEAFRVGYGIRTKNDLLALCKLIWLKSELDENDFNHHFQISFKEVPINFVIEITPETIEEEEKDTERKDANDSIEEAKDNTQIEKEKNNDKDDQLEEDLITDEVQDEVSTMQIANRNFDLEAKKLEEEAKSNFDARKDYLPVTQRKLLSTWRYLRQSSNVQFNQELDIPNTIKEIYQTGFFLKPFYQRNKLKDQLYLLIDITGSMIAFRSLAERIAYTAIKSVARKSVEKYYFRNAPIDFSNDYLEDTIYRDPEFLEVQPISQLLANAMGNKDALMIISDAGAARGTRNLERIEHTIRFIKIVQKSIESIVWINPMPKRRWRRTSASDIAKHVPMFSANELDMHNAIKLLKG